LTSDYCGYNEKMWVGVKRILEWSLRECPCSQTDASKEMSSGRRQRNIEKLYFNFRSSRIGQVLVYIGLLTELEKLGLKLRLCLSWCIGIAKKVGDKAENEDNRRSSISLVKITGKTINVCLVADLTPSIPVSSIWTTLEQRAYEKDITLKKIHELDCLHSETLKELQEEKIAWDVTIVVLDLATISPTMTTSESDRKEEDEKFVNVWIKQSLDKIAGPRRFIVLCLQLSDDYTPEATPPIFVSLPKNCFQLIGTRHGPLPLSRHELQEENRVIDCLVEEMELESIPKE